MSIALEAIPRVERENCAFVFRQARIPCGLDEGFLLQPQYIGHYIAKETFSVKRSGFHSILALFTVSGEGVLLEGEQAIPLTPGSVLLLDCVQPHHYCATADGWEFHYVHFTGASSTAFASYMNKRFTAVHHMGRDAFRSALHQLSCCLSEMEREDAAPTRLSALTYELMMTMAGDSGEDAYAHDAVEAVREAAAYLDTHFAEEISTAALAARAFMTRSYFSTVFKQICGVSPREYWTVRRMEMARHMLDAGESLSAIAEATGYSDTSAFTRAFVRANALTPTQYRRLSLK